MEVQKMVVEGVKDGWAYADYFLIYLPGNTPANFIAKTMGTNGDQGQWEQKKASSAHQRQVTREFVRKTMALNQRKMARKTRRFGMKQVRPKEDDGHHDADQHKREENDGDLDSG